MRSAIRASCILALLAVPLLSAAPALRAAAPTPRATAASPRVTPRGRITRIAVDPAHSATVYAGTSSSGVYRSDNGGGTWNAVSRGLPQTVIAGLAVDPASPGTLFVATAQGVYRSADRGRTWRSEGPPTASPATGVVVDPLVHTTLYAGTGGDGVYRSTDSGSTWSAVGPRLSDVQVLAIDPITPTILFAGTDDGLLIGDAGGDWHRAGLGHVSIQALGIGASDDRIIYAGTPHGVLISRDGGGSWARTGFADRSISTIYVDPRNDGRAYAGSFDDGGLFLTTDAGTSWLPLVAGLPGGAKIASIAFDPNDPAVAYAGLDSGVFKSLQGGSSWASATIYDRSVQALVQPRVPGGAYYAATNGGVYVSTDGGNVWTSAGLGNHSVADLLMAAPDLYAATESGVYRSNNAGHTWTRSLPVASLALATGPGGMILAGTERGLYGARTPDTWTLLPAGADATPALLVLANGDILAGSAAGIIRSVDGGAHFSRTALNGTSIVQLIASSASAGTAQLYARTASGGIWRSDGGGRGWADASVGGAQVSALAVEPGGRLYAASARGVYISASRGLSWILSDQQDPSLHLLVLQPVPGAAGTLLEGLAGQGVLARSPRLTPTAPFAPLTGGTTGQYVLQTGHFVRAPFLDWYTLNGGSAVFGPPRTEARDEGGHLVQYFQNAVLVYHPERADTPDVIALEPLGQSALGTPEPRLAPFDNTITRRYFPRTGHSLGGEFLQFWRTYGGIDVFGPPISEPETDAGGRVVQYFQNARLEAGAGTGDRYYDVRLSPLGDSVLKRKGWLQ